MNVRRLDATNEQLADPAFEGWSRVTAREFPLVPTPLRGNPAIKAISPFIEKSTDHGTVSSVTAASAHNGSAIAVRLEWASAGNDKIVDLDDFVDGVAVMFPLTERASAVTMGSESDPVNAWNWWYWKANLGTTAFDVIARGYGTSGRRNDERHPIASRAVHADGRWHVTLARTIVAAADRVAFVPGRDTRMAFAVWTAATGSDPDASRSPATSFPWRSTRERSVGTRARRARSSR